MRLKDTSSRLRFLLPPCRWGARARGARAGGWSGCAPKTTAITEAPLSESFCAHTLPYLGAVYSDALCLTGCRADAADLVLEAYLRAFREFEQSGGECPPARQRSHGTRAWLLRNLHAAFCDDALSRAAIHKTQTGE